MRISAYTRMVNGQAVEVSGYDRADRPTLVAESKEAGSLQSGGSGAGGNSGKGNSGNSIPTLNLPVIEIYKHLSAGHQQSQMG